MRRVAVVVGVCAVVAASVGVVLVRADRPTRDASKTNITTPARDPSRGSTRSASLAGIVRPTARPETATSTTSTTPTEAATTARLIRDARATDPRAPHTRYLPQGATRMSDEMYRMPSGEVRYFNTMGARPINEGALSIDDILDMEGELAARVQEALWPHFPKIEQCKREMIDRGGVVDREATMMLAIRVVGNGATVRITEIRAVESLWPAVFDEEARRCTMLAFANVEFAWARMVDLVLDYQVGFMPDRRE